MGCCARATGKGLAPGVKNQGSRVPGVSPDQGLSLGYYIVWYKKKRAQALLTMLWAYADHDLAQSSILLRRDRTAR